MQTVAKYFKEEEGKTGDREEAADAEKNRPCRTCSARQRPAGSERPQKQARHQPSQA
ncbi:hypothetical protein NOJ28_10975 [Neorhizobium galegae]|uniref:hypothetical protein n=1 Tax=Neorhizobium galegae TaxID=399 RepID=UPI0021026003|nr:hypothetical protein [Neorhizobium galegae]MCQ1766057.1 hypothetical protein [Neorhizobium galegae]MCQ1844971.1 hypothetical protein [Neorhizobium galegae]